MTSKEKLGAWLKAARSAAGLSRAQLAVRAGVGHVTIGKLERDECDPGLETLEKILAALGKKLGDIPDAARRRSARRT